MGVVELVCPFAFPIAFHLCCSSICAGRIDVSIIVMPIVSIVLDSNFRDRIRVGLASSYLEVTL